MSSEQQRKITEALILASPEPVSAARLAAVVPRLKPAGVKEVIATLNDEYRDQNRGFEIWEVAGGYQLRTLAELTPYVKQLQKERPMRLSRAALETLAVVAYKQPVTRAEVENVRGVDAGAVMRSLLDRRLVKIAGHREVPGRPVLYATGRRFLEVFGLQKLEDLPSLRDLEELLPEPDFQAADDVQPAAEAGAASAEGEAEGEGEPELTDESPPPGVELH